MNLRIIFLVLLIAAHLAGYSQDYEKYSNVDFLALTISSPQLDSILSDCISQFEKHDAYSENISLSSEAERLNVSDTYLSGRFTKETGMNFVEYINAVRIRYACLLLVQLQLPIQRVAELCGFTSSNYFARVFRRSEGRSPSEYRIIMQKK